MRCLPCCSESTSRTRGEDTRPQFAMSPSFSRRSSRFTADLLIIVGLFSEHVAPLLSPDALVVLQDFYLKLRAGAPPQSLPTACSAFGILPLPCSAALLRQHTAGPLLAHTPWPCRRVHHRGLDADHDPAARVSDQAGPGQGAGRHVCNRDRGPRPGRGGHHDGEVRAPHDTDYDPTRWPYSPRIVMRRAPRASAGPDHLGLRALQATTRPAAIGECFVHELWHMRTVVQHDLP